MSLEDFNQELKEKNLIGYWMIPNRSDGFREPKPGFEPFLWKWGEVEEALGKACEYIQPEEAFRRFIGFQHPKLKMGTAHTLLMGAQMVRPGEVAPPHRHTMEAIRFVVKGRGACTVVEGEQFPMEEGDLITTPNWSWHEHVNAADGPVIWLDGANGPMIQYYQIGFAHPYSEPHQPISRPVGWSSRAYGSIRPLDAGHGLWPWALARGHPEQRSESRDDEVGATGSARGDPPSDSISPRPGFRPPYRYSWESTQKTLEALAEGAGDPFDGVHLRYVDPITGGPTLSTLSCEIQLLRPGEKGKSHRHTHTAVYHAFLGSGTTVIGGQRFDWEKGDSFVVPLWNWHAHENRSGEPAVLFSINDRPAIEALGFYREEARE